MSCGVCWGSSSYLGQFKVKTLLVMENGYPISAFTVQVLKRISIFVSGFAMYIITIVAKFFIFFLRKDSVTFFSMTRQHSIAGIFFWWWGGGGGKVVGQEDDARSFVVVVVVVCHGG